MIDVPAIASRFLAQVQPTWRETWPFGPGYAEGWLSTFLKFAFIAVIFGVIVLGLRLLFGPGGPMRGKDWDDQGKYVGPPDEGPDKERD